MTQSTKKPRDGGDIVVGSCEAEKLMTYLFSGGQGSHTSSGSFGYRWDTVQELALGLGILCPVPSWSHLKHGPVGLRA